MDKVLDAIANNIVVLGAFLVPIGIVAVNSFFGHRRLEMIHNERMAAIAKGMVPPGDLPDPHKEERDQQRQENGGKAPIDYLRTGLFWLCPGAGLVAFSLVALADMPPGIRLPIMGVSVLAAGIGLAFIVVHVVEQDRRRTGLQ